MRTPDPAELQDHLCTNITSKQRVMTFWCTTVFDAVKAVCDSTGCTGALVMEDTILLRPDVTYEEVAAEVRRTKSSRWRLRLRRQVAEKGGQRTRGLWLVGRQGRLDDASMV